jgi:hypothetical protein
MLDDGNLPTVRLAGQLEHRPKTGESYVIPFSGLHNRNPDLIRIGHLRYLSIWVTSTKPLVLLSFSRYRRRIRLTMTAIRARRY